MLRELRSMTLSEILSIPLSGRFNGMFETFEEMGKCPLAESLAQDQIIESTYREMMEVNAICVGNYEFPSEESLPTVKHENRVASEVRTCWSGHVVQTEWLESGINDTEPGLEISLPIRGTLWITQQEMTQSARMEALKAA